MKKLLILLSLVALIAISQPSFSKDNNAPAQAAAVTSYTIATGQNLLYSTAHVISGSKVMIEESVTILSLKDKKITVEITSTLKEKEKPDRVLAKKKTEWSPVPPAVMKDIFQRIKPEIQTFVLDKKSFNYIEVSSGSQVWWLVTDGKTNTFPGVLKIMEAHKTPDEGLHFHIKMQLTKVKYPNKK
jgi:hypothetical protein